MVSVWLCRSCRCPGKHRTNSLYVIMSTRRVWSAAEKRAIVAWAEGGGRHGVGRGAATQSSFEPAVPVAAGWGCENRCCGCALATDIHPARIARSCRSAPACARVCQAILEA